MMVTAAGIVAMKMVAGHKKYNSSKALKRTVEGIMKGIETGIKSVKNFIIGKGGKVKKGVDKAKKSKAREKAAGLFERTRNATREATAKAKNAIMRGREVDADELEDEKGNKTSSTDPPSNPAMANVLTKEEIEALAKSHNLEVHEKNKDGLETDDGEPTEKGYLKMLAESVLGEEGLINRGREKAGKWYIDQKERSDRRKEQIEAEKEAVRQRKKEKKKKSGGLLSGLFGKGVLGFLIGLYLLPFKLMLKPVRWLAGAIARSTGRLIWWATKNLIKGMFKVGWFIAKNVVKGIFKGSWWLISKFAGALGKGLKLLGRGIYKMSPQWAKNLFDAVGKWGNKLVSGVKNLGGIFKDSLLDLGSKMKGWFSNLGTKLSSLKETLKPKNLLSKAWTGLKNGFKSGGWARTALSVAGRTLVNVGGRILAGVVAVGPVGWIIGIGLALWGAYELYKYFKDGKAKFPDSPAGRISQLRMYSYGLTSKNNNYFKKMFELEEAIGRFFIRKDDGTIEVKDIDIDAQKQIGEILGLDNENPGPREEAVNIWLSDRFIPAYREFMRVTWNQKNDIKAGEIDKLDKQQLAKMVYDYDPPGQIWETKILPFTDVTESGMTRNEFEEFHLSIKNELKNEWEAIQTKNKNDEDKTVRNKNDTSSSNNNGTKKGNSWDGKFSQASLDKVNKWLGTNYTTEDFANGANGENPNKPKSFKSTYGGDDLNLNASVNPISLINGSSPRGHGIIPGLSDGPAGYGYYGNNGPAIYGPGVPAYTGPNRHFDVTSGEARNISSEEMGSLSLDKVFSLGAQLTGMPEEILWTFAKLETGLNPLAKAKGSSASGLFQMINATWETMVKRYGKKYGIDLRNANRWNPLQNTLMGAEYMKENMRNIAGYKELGLDLGTALYFAHFFGGAGVKSFFAKMRQNPDMPMMYAVSSKVYNANIAAMGGLTIRQFVDKYRARFNKAMETPAAAYAGYKNHRAQFPQLYEGSKPNDQPKGSYDSGGGPILGEGKEGDVATLSGVESTGDGGAVGGAFGGVAGALTGMRNDADLSKNFTANGPSTYGGQDFGDVLANNIGASSGNAGIEMLRRMGLIHKDSKYYNGSDGTYGGGSGGGYGYGDSYGSGSMAQPGDYTGEKEILGFDFASSDNPAMKFHPIKYGYPFYFTSLYGSRNTGIEGASTDHKGVDIGTPTRQAGTPIVATGDGKVWRAYLSESYGLVVYVIHPNGFQTRYAHLSKILVREGQEVDAGMLVGLMGNTGIGSGVHLHFEVRKGHQQESPTIDPFNFDIIKNSYKGHKVPTVIEENGKVDSDEDLTDENLEKEKLESLGVLGPMGLAGLLNRDLGEIQRDPVTGGTKQNNKTNEYEGIFADADGRPTTIDTGTPFDYDTYAKNNPNVPESILRAQANMQLAFAKKNNKELAERSKANEISNIEDQTPKQQDVKVDVDVNTSNLEKTLQNNNAAMLHMTEVMKLFIEKAGGELSAKDKQVLEKEPPKSGTTKSAQARSQMFGGDSVRSTQGVTFK